MYLLRKVHGSSARARLSELRRTLVAETTENGKARLVEEEDVGRFGSSIFRIGIIVPSLTNVSFADAESLLGDPHLMCHG
jgi:hypothetical protein